MTKEPEVLILGGSPAGSAAAGLLARWGLEVVVVERSLAVGSQGGRGGSAVGQAHEPGGSGPGTPGRSAGSETGPTAPSLAESLPPSTRKVLAATGLLGVVEAGGFQPNGGNTALWGGEGRRDDFAGGATGFHVLRSRFDGLLREAAVGAGAEVVGGVARLPERVGEGDGWGVEVVLEGGDRVETRLGWVLDCTGRAGVLARRHRVLETAAPTLAVIRRYEDAAGWANVDPTHALVESFERGWAWSVPTSQRERHVAVMLDPELRAVMEGAPDLTAAFEAEIAGTSLMRSVTTPARPVGRAWAVTASMYTSSAFADGRALLVGDAASFVDPNAPDGPDAAARRDDPEVRAAFHALRLGSGRLRAGRRDTVDRPLIIGNRMRMAPALVTPRFPEGVRYFRDVDLLRVVHLAPGSRNPGALYESYSEWAAREDLPPVDLANFVGVVALLVADGVVVPGGG